MGASGAGEADRACVAADGIAGAEHPESATAPAMAAATNTVHRREFSLMYGS